MGAVRARFRAEFQRRALALFLLSVVVGLAAGAVVALVAAAARTESAYDRFLERSAPSSVLIQDSSSFLGPAVDLEAVAALPEVEQAARGVVLFTGARLPDGRQLRFGDLAGVATVDGAYGRTVDRETVLDGRLADPSRPDEMVVGLDVADRFGIEVGDTVDLVLPTAAEFDAAAITFASRLEELASGPGSRSPFDVEQALPSSLRLPAKVVGIIAAPSEVPPIAGTLAGLARLTPTFYERYAADLAGAGFLAVRVRPGVGIEQFKTAVERLDGGRDAVFLTSEPTQTAAVNRSLDLQATALRAIAGIALVVALLLLGQTLARLTATESDDFPTLRALGMTRRELFVVGMARAAAIAVPTAVVTAVVAIGLSAVFPVGLAGTIEPSPGIDVDATVIGAGCALLLLAIPLLAAIPAWRAARGVDARPSTPRRASRLTGLLNGSRGTSMPLGVRLALEPGRGLRSVPVRTAIAVGSVAIAAASMTVGLSASFSRLRDAPPLYGWNWDAQIGATGLPDVSEPLVAGLERNAAVSEIAVGMTANVSIDGTRVDALATKQAKGNVDPTILEGRAARGTDEIVLGTVTMRELGREIGDRVTVGLGGRSIDLRVVGRAVFPNLGDAAQLGRGAAMSIDALAALDESATRNIMLVRFANGRSPASERLRLAQAINPYPVFGAERPDDLASIGSVDGLVVGLGLTLVALAALTLAHTLVTSVRRRARDLALLKALGFTRRQAGSVIAWQGLTLLGAALVIGLPVGTVLARAVWQALANELGVPPQPTVGALALALIVPLALGFGFLAAVVPIVRAARLPTARVLREE